MRKAKVKCQNCRTDGYNVDFYCVITTSGKRSYYCNEECYTNLSDTTKTTIEIKYLLIDILDCHVNKGLETYINKTLLVYEKHGKLNALHQILLSRRNSLHAYMSRFDFNNIAKIKYLLKMVNDDIDQEIEAQRLNEVKQSQTLEPMFEVNHVKKLKKGRDISDFL